MKTQIFVVKPPIWTANSGKNLAIVSHIAPPININDNKIRVAVFIDLIIFTNQLSFLV